MRAGVRAAEAGGALVTQVVDGIPGRQGRRRSTATWSSSVDGRKVKETRDLIDYVSAQAPGAR